MHFADQLLFREFDCSAKGFSFAQLVAVSESLHIRESDKQLLGRVLPLGILAAAGSDQIEGWGCRHCRGNKNEDEGDGRGDSGHIGVVGFGCGGCGGSVECVSVWGVGGVGLVCCVKVAALFSFIRTAKKEKGILAK
jgi:hypothetical protein